MSAPLAIARIAVNAVKVLGGWVVYLLTGRTPALAHQAFIRLFCLTGGHSSDMISRAVAIANPPVRLPERGGAIGDAILAERESAVEALREHGYYTFRHKLPDALCEQLLRFALTHPCDVRQDDAGVKPSGGRRVYGIDRSNPLGTCYDFARQDLIDNSDIQSLLADPALLHVAQDYFGSRPVADVLGLWWNTAYSSKPSEQAAQFYHFDLDRPKWIKFFFHLTDVTPTTGPHCFVRGSHRSGSIPRQLLAKGYVRLSDHEVAACFPPGRIVEFSAPRGTILVEDTRGLHKGKDVTAGDRLMFQIQFSNSLFGGTYEKVRVSAIRDGAFRACSERLPAVYQGFLG